MHVLVLNVSDYYLFLVFSVFLECVFSLLKFYGSENSIFRVFVLMSAGKRHLCCRAFFLLALKVMWGGDVR